VLAAGFLDLSKASSSPPSAPIAATPVKAEVPPPMPRPAPAAPAAPPSTGLVVLKQEFPQLPYSLVSSGRGEYRGIVEVDIDESGSVTNARMVESVHAFYDPLVLRASRDWKYDPPRVFGKPIPSRKRVEIVLRP
jgi:TonB family protein